jgi:hypothetical protein
MDTSRIPKQALQYKPKGWRNRGRPRKRRRNQLHLEDQGTGNAPNPPRTWWWWRWCVTVKLHHIPYNQIHISLRQLSSHGRHNDGNCLPRHGACSLVWYTEVSEEPATSIIIRTDTVSSSEVSVHVYHRARRHVPENGYLHISLLLLTEGRCSSHAKMFRSVN